MFWKVIKNIVFYVFLLVLVAITIHYVWAPRYYFPESEVFYGKKIYNPYSISPYTKWKKVGIATPPPWYEHVLGRITGEKEQIFINRNYYDTLLFAGNQRIVNPHQPIYKQGLFHDDHFAIGCKTIVWQDYPFIRDIHNKQHRINSLRRQGCLLYLKPSVFFDDYQQDHPELLRSYNGFMVDESFEQVAHLWDRALSAGKYTTIMATALPKNHRYKPETQYRTVYVPQNDTSFKANLKRGNYFVASQYPKDDNNTPSNNTSSLLSEIRIERDSLIVSTKAEAYAISFYTQNGKVRKVVRNAEEAACYFDRKDSYMRAEILFEDGTRYYLNPLYRYNDGSPHHFADQPHKNIFRTWLFRSVGIFGLIIVVWILLYIKRRLRIEIREPKS
ncbi:MAG: hypothetical protein K9J27_11495 [Bacteroidales bacterium]|nr:hypothetical protein [Bacteroidales bacterium]MCF8334057.1 hypothetical protein [Bacteroidales bacterium]